jgi:succinate dehydrogenase/fumarate reductase cytochrome b subunit
LKSPPSLASKARAKEKKMRIKLIWQTFKAHFQMITGIILLGFITAHMIGVSLINFGPDWLDAYTKHLDKSNVIIVLLVLFFVAVLIAHMINGFRLMWPYMRQFPKVLKYVKNMNYSNSYLWFFHYLAGPLIAVLVLIHLGVACFFSGHTITTAVIIKDQLQNWYYFIVMGILLAPLVFHALCGARNDIIKYDIAPKYRTLIFSALVIIGILWVALGVRNLFLFLF